MLKGLYEEFIYKSRYARFREDLNRRETWDETVGRYVDFFRSRNLDVPEDTWNLITNSILNLDVVPSMRALMTAGPALERDLIAGYNCSAVAVDDPRVFDEILYILMCGKLVASH